MITKEEVEEIRAQLPDEWKHLADTKPTSAIYEDFITNGKFDLEKINGYIYMREWEAHIGF